MIYVRSAKSCFCNWAKLRTDIELSLPTDGISSLRMEWSSKKIGNHRNCENFETKKSLSVLLLRTTACGEIVLLRKIIRMYLFLAFLSF